MCGRDRALEPHTLRSQLILLVPNCLPSSSKSVVIEETLQDTPAARRCLLLCSAHLKQVVVCRDEGLPPSMHARSQPLAVE
eukprot:1157697-Pelagomonas_calceolata.AAC.6